MKRIIPVLALSFVSLSAFAYDIRKDAISTSSPENACSLAMDSAKTDADAACHAQGSFLSAFRPDEGFQWVKQSDGSWRCTVSAYYTCY